MSQEFGVGWDAHAYYVAWQGELYEVLPGSSRRLQLQPAVRSGDLAADATAVGGLLRPLRRRCRLGNRLAGAAAAPAAGRGGVARLPAGDPLRQHLLAAGPDGLSWVSHAAAPGASPRSPRSCPASARCGSCCVVSGASSPVSSATTVGAVQPVGRSRVRRAGRTGSTSCVESAATPPAVYLTPWHHFPAGGPDSRWRSRARPGRSDRPAVAGAGRDGAREPGRRHGAPSPCWPRSRGCEGPAMPSLGPSRTPWRRRARRSIRP